ncbi:MAG: phosphoglycolate phosphatase [Gammaproteobacteria bacterium]
MRTRLVLFDLDGTLVDSAPDIADAANAALRDGGFAARPEAEIRAFIGNGAERLIHRCLTGTREGVAEAALHAATLRDFQRHYAVCLVARTRPFPGVIDTLEALAARDVLLGCVTNKPARFTLPLLEGLGLAHYFQVTYAGDTLPVKKPDPAPLLAAARSCRARPADTVMVGDSMTDFAAARAAGMRIFCVGYGYAAGVDLAAQNPDAYVRHMPDILPVLARD